MRVQYHSNKAGRWLLAIVLLTLSSIEANAAKLDPKAPKFTVNFRATPDGLILVDGAFGKGQTHTFMLDSGTTYPGFLDQETAIEAGLKVKERNVLVHIEGNAPGVVDTREWREATVVQKNAIKVILLKGAFPTTDFSALSKAIGSPIAGLIGMSAFSRYVVEIDYATGKLSFFEPDKFQYSGVGQAFPLEKNEDALIIKAQIELDDCTFVPVRLYLDSGSNSDVTFNHLFVEAHPNLGDQKLDPRSIGLASTLDASWGVVHSLVIGHYSVPVPNTVLLHSDAAEALDTVADGSLGSKLLSMFTVFVDRTDGKIIFEPRTDKPLTPVKPCVPSLAPHIQPPGQP